MFTVSKDHRFAASSVVITCTVAAVALALSLAACQPASERGGQPQPAPRSAVRSLQAERIHYAALGDSYASAPGVLRSRWAQGCERSTNNYPSQVALAIRAESFDDRTCSGAQTRHAATAQPERSGHPQLDAVRANTTLVTLNFGGNDERLFRQLIRTCLRLANTERDGSPCRDHYRSTGDGDLLQVAGRVEDAMVALVHTVQRRAPNARVLIVGYPQLASSTPLAQPCSRLPLARGDYAYAAHVNQELNASLRSAARRTGTDYIDVARASRGHDICSDDPWVRGRTLLGPATFFHPFRAEQNAVATLIVAQLAR